MTGKRWEIINKLKVKSEKFKVEDIVTVLLGNRGVKTKTQEKEFFSPTHPDKLTPKDFGIDPKELNKAIKRIKGAKEKKEKVVVWGDYDADGICGAAVLWEALYYSGVNAVPFIPERRTEGYGLNVARMKQLKNEDPSVGLIITVDNGIVAHEKVDLARELGVDVIITDHHLPRQTRPKAYAILHTTAISGAGVAWILARELKIENLKLKIVKDWLGIVALATIADMVPLTGPARSLVFHGLPVLRGSLRPGIVSLCRQTGIDQGKIGTYEVGFILAPRLNAMGRLEHALESLRLLCTRSPGRAQELARLLNETNANRQQMVVDTVVHARETVLQGSKNGIIFVSHESYHEGIVGLVASRLVEEFGRPAVVVSRGEELSRGSARSIPGLNIVNLLDKSREFLVEGGGHAMAAGFTVKTEHIGLLAKSFQENSNPQLTEDLLTPRLRVDCEISLSVATSELAQELKKFAPFGIGNPEPIFATRGVLVEDARLVGAQNQHLKLVLRQDAHIREVIGFGMGELYGKLSPECAVDIAYAVQLDSWNGKERLQLKLKDLKTG